MNVITFPQKAAAPIHLTRVPEPARAVSDNIAGSLLYPLVAFAMIGAMLPFLPLAAGMALMDAR